MLPVPPNMLLVTQPRLPVTMHSIGTGRDLGQANRLKGKKRQG